MTGIIIIIGNLTCIIEVAGALCLVLCAHHGKSLHVQLNDVQIIKSCDNKLPKTAKTKARRDKSSTQQNKVKVDYVLHKIQHTQA